MQIIRIIDGDVVTEFSNVPDRVAKSISTILLECGHDGSVVSSTMYIEEWDEDDER